MLELARYNHRCLLLLQEIILHPKGQSIHNDGYHNDNQNKLKRLIRLYPPNQKHSNGRNGRTQQHLRIEQQCLREYNYDIPYSKLHHPIEITYPKLVHLYAYLVFLRVIYNAMYGLSPSNFKLPPNER